MSKLFIQYPSAAGGGGVTTVINTTASGNVTITGAGDVEVFTQGAIVTVSGAEDAAAVESSALVGIAGITVISGTNTTIISGTTFLVKEPTGFENTTDSTISLNESTGLFTIAPTTSGGTYDYYIQGVHYTQSTPQSVVVSGSDGLHLVLFDGSNLIQILSSDLLSDLNSILTDYAYVSYVYWNTSSGTATIFAEERHGLVMDNATHEYLHKTIGTVYVSGLNIGSYTTTGTGDLDSDAQVALTGGVIADEDLQHTITHALSPSAAFEQILEPQAKIPVFYRLGVGGIWTKDEATLFPVKQGTQRIQYNVNTAGTWTAEDVNGTNFVAMWVAATNDVREPLIAILGQRQDAGLAGARSNNVWTELDFGIFPTPELRVLYRLIFQTANGYTNTPHARLRDVADMRLVSISPVGLSAANDHGALIGLSDDDHEQYLLASGTRPLSATWNVGSQDITGVDALTAVTGTFTQGITVGGGTTYIYPHTVRTGSVTTSGSITGTTASFSTGLTVSGTPVSLGGGGVSDHGALTGLLDDDHPQYLNTTRANALYAPLTPRAILGDGGLIAVSSGTNADTILAKAITGSDGVTVSSGTYTVDVAGFHSEFVSASGSLQSQISALDSTYATDAELVTTSGHLQSQLDTLPSVYATTAALVTVSGHLQDAIDAAEASDVDSITASGNELAGAVTLEGLGSVSLHVAGNTIAISGSPIAEGESGVSDHGALTGLSDDDHTQYLLVDGSRSATSIDNTGNYRADGNVAVTGSLTLHGNFEASKSSIQGGAGYTVLLDQNPLVPVQVNLGDPASPEFSLRIAKFGSSSLQFTNGDGSIVFFRFDSGSAFRPEFPLGLTISGSPVRPKKFEWSRHEISVSGTAANTPIMSFTVPANTLGTEGRLHFELYGKYRNQSGEAQSMNIRFFYGGVGMYDDWTASVGSAVTEYPFVIEGSLNAMGNTSRHFLEARVFRGAGGPTTVASGIGELANTTPGIDNWITSNGIVPVSNTTNKTFTIDVKHSVASSTVFLTIYTARAWIE